MAWRSRLVACGVVWSAVAVAYAEAPVEPAVAVAGIIVPAPTAADSVRTADVQVIGGPVAVVRAGPGPEHAIVATVREGQILILDAKSGDRTTSSNPKRHSRSSMNCSINCASS